MTKTRKKNSADLDMTVEQHKSQMIEFWIGEFVNCIEVTRSLEKELHDFPCSLESRIIYAVMHLSAQPTREMSYNLIVKWRDMVRLAETRNRLSSLQLSKWKQTLDYILTIYYAFDHDSHDNINKNNCTDTDTIDNVSELTNIDNMSTDSFDTLVTHDHVTYDHLPDYKSHFLYKKAVHKYVFNTMYKAEYGDGCGYTKDGERLLLDVAKYPINVCPACFEPTEDMCTFQCLHKLCVSCTCQLCMYDEIKWKNKNEDNYNKGPNCTICRAYITQIQYNNVLYNFQQLK